MSESLIIAALTCVILLLMVLLVSQRKHLLRLKGQVAEFEREELPKEQVLEGFAEELMVAEGQIPEQKGPVVQEMPDRYRYVRAMARQGMNAPQIAKILQVGEEEAAQIVRLARLKTDV